MKVEQALETISLLIQGDKTDKSMEPPGKIPLELLYGAYNEKFKTQGFF